MNNLVSFNAIKYALKTQIYTVKCSFLIIISSYSKIDFCEPKKCENYSNLEFRKK